MSPCSLPELRPRVGVGVLSQPGLGEGTELGGVCVGHARTIPPLYHSQTQPKPTKGRASWSPARPTSRLDKAAAIPTSRLRIGALAGFT